MNTSKLLLAALLGLFCLSGHAADFRFADDDCAEILERWATDPDSVPQRLVDECREAMSSAEPAPAMVDPGADTGDGQGPVAAAADADPCVGPNASSSVRCWGPWAALAPAAGSPGPVTLANVDEYEPRPELADEFAAGVDDPPLDLPIEGCAPGTPCGFATVVAGTLGQGEAADTRFARFDLAPDGTSFVVDPETGGDIASVGNMTPAYFDRSDEFENMRASGLDGDERSRIIARVLRDNDGNIQTSADLWGHGNANTGQADSGFYAWGTTTSANDLATLNGQGVSIAFAGPMSVDNSTNAALTINFGVQPTWNGTWTNPAYNFDAGGRVDGANFLSSPDQFSTNVSGDSFVQGAILGERGDQSIAHIIDVTLDGAGRVKDVGLLREVNNTVVEARLP